MGRAKPAAPAKGDAPTGGNIWQVLLTGARKGEGKGKGAAPAAPAPEQAGETRWRITPRGLAYLQELEGCSGQGQGPLASGLVSEPWPAAEETPEAAPAEASPEAAAAEEISEETQEGTAGWLEDLLGGGAAVAAAEAARPRAEAARPHEEAPEADLGS